MFITKKVKLLASSVILSSIFYSNNAFALEDGEVSENFFPIGVYFVRGQKPIEDDVNTWDNGDFRGDPLSAEKHYNIEFKDLKDYGFNTAILNINPLVHPNIYLNKRGEEKSQAIKSIVDEVLSAASDNNIQIVPTMGNLEASLNTSYNISESTIKSNLLADHIEYFHKSKNVLGYQIIDEPNRNVNKDNLAKTKEVIKEFDNNALSLSTWNNIKTIESLNETINPDIVLIDVYPFATANHSGFSHETSVGNLEDAFPRGRVGSGEFNEGFDQPSFSNWIKSAKSKIGDTPLWVAIQSFGGDTYFRDVSAKEVRLQSFMAIKNGAKGLFYFLFQSESNLNGLMDDNYQPTLLALEASEINKEVNKISPILLKIKDTDINYSLIKSNRDHSQHEVQTFVHENGDKYLMAVNADTFSEQDLEVKIKKSWFKNINNLNFIDIYEPNDSFNVDITSDSEYIVLTLLSTDAADGRLIKIDESKSNILYSSKNKELYNGNSKPNTKSFFAQLGDLTKLTKENEVFSSLKLSVNIKDNIGSNQRYKLAVRFGHNDERIWNETIFHGSGSYKKIEDGWQKIEYDFVSDLNEELLNNNKYLTRILVRAYNKNPDNYVDYEVKDFLISYETEEEREME